MSATGEAAGAVNSNGTIELVEKIHQFFAHQIETNRQLSSSARESLAVANECIEQAYSIQKKPASNELLELYNNQQQQTNSATNSAQANPAQFIQNLASQILNSATASAAGAGAGAGQPAASNAAGLAAAAAQAFSQAFSAASANPQQQPDVTSSAAQQQQQATSNATSSDGQGQSQAKPPRQRKRATEAERIAAESFKNQGNDLMKQDKFKEAYDCYTQAIQIDENNAIYYSNRAAASSKLHDHQAALRDCEEAVEIDPNYSKAYGRMGLAYASLEDHKRARGAYIKAVELDPNNESYRNNLKIAEDKLAEEAGGGQQSGANPFANLAGGAGGLQNNMMGMLRSMMGNPQVMQMAMQSLQDPRMQSLFGMATGGAQTDPNNQQPPNTHS